MASFRDFSRAAVTSIEMGSNASTSKRGYYPMAIEGSAVTATRRIRRGAREHVDTPMRLARMEGALSSVLLVMMLLASTVLSGAAAAASPAMAMNEDGNPTQLVPCTRFLDHTLQSGQDGELRALIEGAHTPSLDVDKTHTLRIFLRADTSLQ